MLSIECFFFQRPMKQSVFFVGKLKTLVNKYSALVVAVTIMAVAWSHLLIWPRLSEWAGSVQTVKCVRVAGLYWSELVFANMIVVEDWIVVLVGMTDSCSADFLVTLFELHIVLSLLLIVKYRAINPLSLVWIQKQYCNNKISAPLSLCLWNLADSWF